MNWKRKVKTSYALLIVFIWSAFLGSQVWVTGQFSYPDPVFLNRVAGYSHKLLPLKEIPRPKPQPVSMSRLKSQGCVTDGLLSEYNPDRENYIDLMNRSSCYYFHRAVETWLTPPDFETIDYAIGRITKKDVVYGMFIAEALKENAKYYNNEEQRNFDFGKMCQPGSEGTWGMHSCKADFGSAEYRNYLRYITHRAIDLGIQSFTFGQIYMQEGSGGDRTKEIIQDIRSYAKKHKVDVVIGAQTGTITDRNYLSMFDYIEGGVGINEAGNLPQGPCLTRWGGCWALLWNGIYSQNAKNVLLHLDWTGIKSDDLDTFARMDKETRSKTLQGLYDYFSSRNMGFLMPFFGVLDKTNGGCYGPKKMFYSADNQYRCQDEDIINNILSGKK